MNKKELLNIIAYLKQTIEDQALITRRTIVKNAQKGDYLTLRNKRPKYEERMKHDMKHEMENYDQLDSEILKQLIYVTSEECGELVQASMKIARWGIDKKRHTNLLEEAGDVRCMLDLMIENGLFTEEELKDQAKVKRNKLKRYTPIIVKE